MIRRLILFQLLLTGVGMAASGQRHYVCYFAVQRPVIDGSDDEAVWQQAPWTQDFVDIEGAIRPRPPLRTRARMLWDSTYLYVYAELEEPDLWGTLRQHDTVIYDDNDFEVFINPDNSTHRYYELEINALGTVMDLFMDKPYRNGGKALLSWDTQGLISAVQARGTLNHPGDVDSGWSVEMAIPLKSLSFWGDAAVRGGTQWRINFSRVEWDRDVVDGQYRLRTDAATGMRLPEHNWVWSPQGQIDMHMPEKWAYLQFSTHRGGTTDTVGFVRPADLAARKWLWAVYDAQKDFERIKGRYARSLEELGLKGDGGERQMWATPLQFIAAMNVTDKYRLSIDQEGEVLRLK